MSEWRALTFAPRHNPFKSMWADPAGRARLLKAGAKGSKRAAELKRARYPLPDTPEGRSLYRKLVKHLGAKAARQAMNLVPAATAPPVASALASKFPLDVSTPAAPPQSAAGTYSEKEARR